MIKKRRPFGPKQTCCFGGIRFTIFVKTIQDRRGFSWAAHMEFPDLFRPATNFTA